MATGTIRGKGKPKGFQLIPEGEQVLHITGVEGTPRAAIQTVSMEMHNADGISLTGNRKQSYNLNNDGGYAAFYYLVLNGLGVDLDEGDEFDIADLEDVYVLAEIVHNKVPKKDKDSGQVIPDEYMTFANIKKIIGPAEPFAAASKADDSGDDEDYE